MWRGPESGLPQGPGWLSAGLIDRAMDEWQNDCWAVSMLKDSIQTHVVTVNTAKHFVIPIETLFV